MRTDTHRGKEMTADWTLQVSHECERALGKLDRQVATRITKTLKAIAATGKPRSRGKALTGDLGQFWCYRIGDYRVLCELHDTDLIILAIEAGHRSTIYKTHA